MCKMLHISVDILAFGTFLDLRITFHCQWLMALKGLSHQVGTSISSTFWKNTNYSHCILSTNNIMYCLYNIVWSECFIFISWLIPMMWVELNYLYCPKDVKTETAKGQNNVSLLEVKIIIVNGNILSVSREKDTVIDGHACSWENANMRTVYNPHSGFSYFTSGLLRAQLPSPFSESSSTTEFFQGSTFQGPPGPWVQLASTALGTSTNLQPNTQRHCAIGDH